MITINLSNCPNSGLSRKATYKLLNHNVDSKEIIITTEVAYISSDTVVDAKGIAPYQVKLIADNSTKVNPANGDFVDETFTAATVGQYDFIVGAMQSGVNPFVMIQSHMEKADLTGKYN